MSMDRAAWVGDGFRARVSFLRGLARGEEGQFLLGTEKVEASLSSQGQSMFMTGRKIPVGLGEEERQPKGEASVKGFSLKGFST